MLKTVCALIAFALCAGAAGAATVIGDPDHSNATFTVKHLAITSVSGTIPITSWTAMTGSADAPASVSATLDVRGIDTKQPDRDRDLRGADWFDVARFPAMTFKSANVSAGPSGTFTMTGQLSMHGVTKPVTFAGKFEGSAVDGKGNKRVAYSASTTIDRRDFGLNFGATSPGGQLIVGYPVTITLSVEGIARP